MRTFAAAGVLVLLSASAVAQQPANPQAPGDRASYMSAADLAAAIAKVPTDRPSSNVRVFSLGPYNVNVEKRNPVAQGASSHDAVAELFHVLDGSGVIVTGGTIPNANRNGTNLQGKTIEGGTRQILGKGDWILVPSGVPHQFADIKGNLTIMSLYLPNQK